FEDPAHEREGRAAEPLLEPESEPILAERYVVLDEIGRGGMGIVNRAFDRRLGREVALKRCVPGRDDGARLLAEARGTARLEHPGIPPVYDVGVDGLGRPFFVMKLLAGRTLAEVLGAAEARGEEAAQLERLGATLVEVARTVAHAHERGVVHRDLKPEN